MIFVDRYRVAVLPAIWLGSARLITDNRGGVRYAPMATTDRPTPGVSLCVAPNSGTTGSQSHRGDTPVWSRGAHRSSVASFAITIAFRIQELPSDEYEGKEGSAWLKEQ